MNFVLALVIHSANVLGIFSDPFEFEGDYGAEVNLIRDKVFERVVAKEALAQNLTNNQRALAIVEDQQHGPTLFELVPPAILREISQKLQKSHHPYFIETKFTPFYSFIEKFGDKKLFRFFRHLPSALLRMDKTLRDQAAREGKNFDWPILSSLEPLAGTNANELKLKLLEKLFDEKNFYVTKSPNRLKEALYATEEGLLKELLGEKACHQDLEFFCTPAGQLLFYWLYHSLDLHLIAEEPNLIAHVNLVKETFASTLGNPLSRALTLKNNLVKANTAVLFTQESDAYLPAILQEDLFLPVDEQNPGDGCFVFLRKDLWEANYEVIPLLNYAGYKSGKVNLVLTSLKNSGEKFLLASCHGHSTNSADGRMQIERIMEQFRCLSNRPENKGLQLLIGIDANTKSPEEIRLFRQLLDSLGLVATDCGPTTIKRRLVTTQHAKAGKYLIDEEDYIITLKPESGGRYELANQTIGFKNEKPAISVTLPNLENPSDHYPVGATLQALERAKSKL